MKPYYLPIAEAGGRYMVNQEGGVLNPRTGKMIKPSMNRQGYLVVNLACKTIRIARAVAGAFIPNPENKPQVNHINGIKTDNRVENLEWATASENQQHAGIVLGRRMGEKNYNHSMTDEDVIWARAPKNAHISCAALGRRLGVTKQVMHLALTGKTWRHLNKSHPPRKLLSLRPAQEQAPH